MILLGIALHALGGIAAATCYISQKGATKWSWQTYWIIFCLVAWFLMPMGVSALTVPDLAGFAGYPKYIFLTGGSLLTNLVWLLTVCLRSGTDDHCPARGAFDHGGFLRTDHLRLAGRRTRGL